MNLGDSRALLCRHGVGVVKETADHKPDAPTELARIRESNGFVSEASAQDPARVDGILSVARALGDFRWKGDASRAPEAQRISPLPDVYDLEVRGGDVIVLACDGVFDVLSSEEAAALALGALGTGEATGASGAAAGAAAEAVVHAALAHGTGDNVTCVVAQLLPD